jgi:two-component system invasion response regulator UvrY
VSNNINTIGLADDHKLFRKGMTELINAFPGYQVMWEANHGKEVQDKMSVASQVPAIVLLDINMPEMDGYQTAAWLKQEFPHVKVLALSMYDDEQSIIKIIKCGARGYILKDAEPTELKTAFDTILHKGFYYSEIVSNALVNNLHGDQGAVVPVSLNDRELEFLKLACTELTYKEIADKMCLAPRTIDGYREALFEKLDVKNRVGLVLYAIRKGIVNVNQI